MLEYPEILTNLINYIRNDELSYNFVRACNFCGNHNFYFTLHVALNFACTAVFN